MEPKVVSLSLGEIVALATFGASILGALFHIVWLLSKMKTQLEHLIDYRKEVDKRLDDHEACIDDHDRDISNIKGHLRLTS